MDPLSGVGYGTRGTKLILAHDDKRIYLQPETLV